MATDRGTHTETDRVVVAGGGGGAGWFVAAIVLIALVLGGLYVYNGGIAKQDSVSIDLKVPDMPSGGGSGGSGGGGGGANGG